MRSLIQPAAVVYFRQALLQLNAIHNLSPNSPAAELAPRRILAPLLRLRFRL
jgi:hypothetical protein